MDKHLRRIEIRRGLSSQRTTVLYEEGEPVYLLDKKRLYIGDNKTFGGNIASNLTFVQNDKSIPERSQPSDIIIDKTEDYGSSGYYINNDSSLTQIFSFCCKGIREFIDSTNRFFDNVSERFCDTTKSLITDDNIAISDDDGVYLEVEENLCNIPFFNKKYLNFTENQTYVLDILSPLKNKYINFDNNLPDGDTNIPPKSIYIIKDSIKTSDLLEASLDGFYTLNLKTKSLPSNKTETISLSYGIQNTCGKIIYGTVNGYLDPSSIRRFVFDFDYMLVTYSFSDGKDLEGAVKVILPEIKGQPEQIWRGDQFPKTDPFIIHSGDNIGTGQESILFDLKKFKLAYSSVENLILDFKTMWYGSIGKNPIVLKLDLYKGGTYNSPSKYNFTFQNTEKQLNIEGFGKVVNVQKIMVRHSTFKFNTKTFVGSFDNNDTETPG